MLLSANNRRIEEIAEDLETQLLERRKNHRGMQSGLTNQQISTTRQYYVFTCDICQEDEHEDLLSALTLLINTTGADLSKSLDGCISGELKGSIYVGVCIDGAAVLTRCLPGLTARTKEVAAESEARYYVIHR